MTAHSSHADVLIVGAGPTGLTLAIDLLRHGVRPRLIDRRDGPETGPRALGLQVRALEIGEALGVADRWLERGNWCEGFRLHAGAREETDLAHDLAHLRAPMEGTLFLDQTETEAALRDRLGELGGAIEWNAAFQGAHDRGNGFGVLLERDGERETLHADWLVGADGARSPVREALGIGFPGRDDVPWLVAELDLDTPLSRDRVHMCRTPEGNAVLFPFGPGDRWSVVDTEPPARAPETVEERAALAAVLQRRVREATGTSTTVRLGDWVSRFVIPSRHATAMRAGRGFLAGDAAHVHSPASGRGMNGGIEDAVALGWRLALAVRGSASDALLDGYRREREAAAKRLLDFSWAGTRLIEERPRPVHTALGALIRLQDRIGPLHDAVARFYTGEMSGLVDGSSPPRLAALDPAIRGTPAAHALLEWLRRPHLKALGGRGVSLDAARAVEALVPNASCAVLGDSLPDPDGALSATLDLDGRIAIARPDGREAARCDGTADALAAALDGAGVRAQEPVPPLDRVA